MATAAQFGKTQGELGAGCASLTQCSLPCEAILAQFDPSQPLIPELLEMARHPETWRDRPSIRLALEATAPYLADIRNIPPLTYTIYNRLRNPETPISLWEAPYFEKRAKLSAAALQVLLGDNSYLDALQDYIWSICEETTWIHPHVEQVFIELRAVLTGFALAEIMVSLGDRLAEEIVQRARAEIERRIFTPYLERHDELWWYRGHNNWNGVCNAAIGATFLHLERDPKRLAKALELVLAGLAVFLETAFDADGSSNEGVSYWQYGLSNLICFAELLRRRTDGAIDILASERVRALATYPPQVMLSPGHVHSYSDCEERVAFSPGLISRLAERTGVSELLGLLAEPAELTMETRRFHVLWRNALWWNGTRPPQPPLSDAWMREGALVRLVAATPDGVAVALAAKAGHNAASHNQNDVGSFVLHADGETFLCDPGRGQYGQDYFSPRRYKNIFANSFGHSVPRIAGQLQSPGRQFRGEITRYDAGGAIKVVEMDIAKAYDVPALHCAHRSLRLVAEGEGAGDLLLEDTFAFSGNLLPVEEAFVTWCEVTVAGRTAHLAGDRHILQLTIEEPMDAAFNLQVLEKESAANNKRIPLKRLAFDILPSADKMVARMRATVLPARPIETGAGNAVRL